MVVRTAFVLGFSVHYPLKASMGMLLNPQAMENLCWTDRGLKGLVFSAERKRRNALMNCLRATDVFEENSRVATQLAADRVSPLPRLISLRWVTRALIYRP